MNSASCFLKKLFCTLEKLSTVVISVLLSLNTFFIIHVKSVKSCNMHIDLLFAIPGANFIAEYKCVLYRGPFFSSDNNEISFCCFK